MVVVVVPERKVEEIKISNCSPFKAKNRSLEEAPHSSQLSRMAHFSPSILHLHIKCPVIVRENSVNQTSVIHQ